MIVRRRTTACLGGALARAAGRLRGFRSDRRGALAVWVALGLIPLCLLVFGVFDLSRMSVERRRLQDSLDAATLIAARSTATDTATLTTLGNAALTSELGKTATSSSFVGSTNGKQVTGTASVTIAPIILGLIGKKELTVGAQSVVVRAANNLEIALVLDITGSMAGTRISDLKTAATDLVDIVVQDVQDPYYSKVAIVPYSMGVNVGTYADAVRGAVPSSALASAAWNTATTKTVSSFTSGTSSTVTTSAAHGLAVNDYVMVLGSNQSSMNGKVLRVTSVGSTTKFTGANQSGTSISAGSSGTVYKCLNSGCTFVITTKAAHVFQAGDQLTLAGITGLTALNSATPTINSISGLALTTNLSGSASTSYATVTAGANGTGSCLSTSRSDISCANLNFTNASGSAKTLALSTCATERTGTYAYTDDAPTTALVGRNYPASSNPCPTPKITPLTSDRTTLKNQISALDDGGSTAGQIGLAWGWYMVSPNFAYLWPNSAQKPAAYGTAETMKIVVMMTDGAFNTPYCKGVIASNAGSGSGSASDHINCNATNGDATAQAKELCTKIKAKNVIIFTVGFDVDSTAKSMLTTCATKTSQAYFPATGGELKTAFKSIAQEISALRIAK
ncbi:pilus assembly protein TadG [Caulobacter flavus]|uniref:Pilus assembly protein TadG n=1 Tax=Caulobacter flavus TaxID=1679497 RepID=A0A2N5CSM3_9CAUL|nr:TadE/TadG family type IV pilus assembly protein [Caulobacter flavus]AYV45638.1 pilus assembly protein TadG [Caulobacter flavus]PLR13883.1 pilus assembly protein TadG [Caulobacter flavus]